MEQVIVFISLPLFICYAVLIIYYRRGWKRIESFVPAENFSPSTKISIIIPARNEQEKIGACLSSIVSQRYPPDLFEVLVVDDHSTDATADIVGGFQKQNIQLLSLKNFIGASGINSYKKKAIEIAIQQSSGELIVTTDADCVVSPGWLRTIAAFYQQTGAAFIAMPVGYDSKNNFIEIFQALDFMTLQGITGASVYQKVHSMCNGANIAYSKNAFIQAGGFKGIDNIASGDDMLLMHKISRQFPGSVFFLKSKEVIVHTSPMNTVSGFFNQRVRWASKADKYDDKRIFAVLVLVYFFNAMIPALGIMAGCYHFVYYFLGILAAKTLVELYFLYPVARFFNQQTMLWWFPIAQPFHILYTIIAGWLGKFGSYRWKGRKVV